MQDSHSLPSHPSLTLTIHHRKSQQMRSFNSGRERWCALSPSVKEEPLRFGVQSLASKEFVTWMDILIGPLTFGKTLPDTLMSRFFPADPKLKLSPLHTPLTTSSCTPFPPITVWDFFSQVHYTLPPFQPFWLNKRDRKRLVKIIVKSRQCYETTLHCLCWSHCMVS